MQAAFLFTVGGDDMSRKSYMADAVLLFVTFVRGIMFLFMKNAIEVISPYIRCLRIRRFFSPGGRDLAARAGVLLKGETLTMQSMLGCKLILTGILLAEIRGRTA